MSVRWNAGRRREQSGNGTETRSESLVNLEKKGRGDPEDLVPERDDARREERARRRNLKRRVSVRFETK